jgi:Inner membrane component of T3SS, cytoplasmic domain
MSPVGSNGASWWHKMPVVDEMVSLSTRTDLGASVGWCIQDPVIRLRERGSERVYGLPDTPTELTLGSGSACELKLRDSSRQISRRHAKLRPFAGGWRLEDQDSKNGLWCDGARRLEFSLTPGLEIQIGSLTLIAESRRSIALRELLCRLLGWSAQCQGEVDEALRSLRDWAARRVSLILMGDGDLTTVARHLHAAVLGHEPPFVVGNEHASGLAALKAAGHGTLWASELPSDLAAMAEPLREADNRTRLMLHARSAEDVAMTIITLARQAVIALPSLSSRRAELRRLIETCGEDAAVALEAPFTRFTTQDVEALARLRYRGIAHLELTVRRVVAMRAWGVSNGAERLDISHVALLTWAQRRNLEP